VNPDLQAARHPASESDCTAEAAERRHILRTLSDDLFGTFVDIPGRSARSNRTAWPDDPVVRRAIEARSADPKP